MATSPNIVEHIMAAIASVESRGAKDPYTVLGKKTKTGDRAHGKYQVMGAYIPSWTKEALGKSMTPQQFLNDPVAQDAVARQRMGNLYQKYGNVNDVASVWFSGRPYAKAMDAQDITGTSTRKYVAMVAAAMPTAAPSLPQPQVAEVVSSSLKNAYNNLFGVNPNLQYKREETASVTAPANAPTSATQYPSLSRLGTPGGRITVPFGGQTTQEKFHPGVDVATKFGTPFSSPVKGIVANVDTGHQKNENNFGNNVTIQDANGQSHRFSHMANAYVKVGQPISKGQKVGEAGNSGATYSESGLGDGTNIDYRITTKFGQMRSPMLYLKDMKLG